MKTKNYKIYTILLVLVLALFACHPEEFNLGKTLSKEDLSFRITQDANDPNMVILESLTPGATPLWTTPMGRSTRVKDTLRFPFAGDYEFNYSVLSAGGLVEADKYNLSITTNNFDYVTDPLWTMLTGGVGKSKTWVLDLFPKDVAPTFDKYFKGPLYFYGTADSWTTVTEGKTVEGDSWNWQADWLGNGSWLFGSETQLDYGTMTFDLIGGAHLAVNHKILGRNETGNFMLDAKNHTMRTTDAYILHDAGRNGAVVDWGILKVLSLTENTMQLAVLRDKALSGEDPCLLVYNFISKDYSDNWVAPNLPDPEPVLPDGWLDDISMAVSYDVKWVLSPETPFNWCNLDGSFMNAWNAVGDYPDWTGFNASVPATYANFSLTLNSKENTAIFVAPDGTKTSGTYTLDEKGIYTFNGVTPSFNICSWVNLSTTADNQWRITKIETDATGAISGMWVGSKDPAKAEYMAYHLIPQFGNSVPDPLAAWKKALVGKTFAPDVNWFLDWVTSPPAFSGGWTSASTFGSDYTSNGWVWTAETRAIAEAASLYFFMDGTDMKCTKTQGTASETSIVTIDPDKSTLVFGMELINYDGSPANWLPRGGDGVIWHFVSHGDSNLTNLNVNGMWLGFENSKPGENGKVDGETTILHYLIK